MKLKSALLVMSFALAAQAAYKIDVTATQTVPTLVIKGTVKTSELAQALGKALPTVYQFCLQKNVPINGAPFTRFHKYEPQGLTEYEAGLPAVTALPLENDIVASSLPAGKAITTLHKGPYQQIGAAYDALHQWMKDAGAAPAGGPWEVYLNDPGSVPPAEYLTQIYYPIK